MPNEVKQQLWRISLSLTSSCGPNMDFEIIEKYKPFWKNVNKGKLSITKEILQGVPESSSSFVNRQQGERIGRLLGSEYNIFNENDFSGCVTYFFNGSNMKRSFEEKRLFFISLSQKERISFLNSFSKDEWEYNQYSIINQYARRLPAAGIMAYDISNCVSICRLGLYSGYLNENELAQYLNPLAIMAQKNYSNFEEFALSSTVGSLYSIKGFDNDIYFYYLENLTNALIQPGSYWNNLDWNLDIV